MPNWKKVIVSGSDAVLNNITATGDVIVQGDIIAENYIVSSSVTYMTQSFFDGSTIFGNDDTDTHQFTGSLYLSQSSINLDYGGIIFGSSPGDINIWPATANDRVSIKGHLLADYITSSNDILVEGTIQGPASIPLWSINANGLGTFDSLTVNGTVNLNGTFNNYGNGANDRHTFTGNITASNDISASGDIYGNSYNIKDAGVITLISPFINFGNNSYHSQYKGTSHLFPAAITASIISASSDLYAGLDEDDNTSYKTVVYNTITGQLFYTGSYGGGGGEDDDWYTDLSNNQLTSSLDIYVKNNITASNNISAANNISASNSLYASDIKLLNQKFASPSLTTTTNFYIGNSGQGSLILTNITASGNISASNLLYAKTPEDVNGDYNNVVVYDTSTGQFYHTGSYGGGGGALDLQDVTDNGEITTNGGRFFNGQSYLWGGWSSATALSGFQVNGSTVVTRVTPQREVNTKFYLTGHRAEPSNPSSGRLDYDRNYIVYNPAVYFNGGGSGGGGGGGGTPTDGEVGGLIVDGGGLQLKTNTITGSISESSAISFVPGDDGPTIYFFERASEVPNQSGSINHNSASAKFTFNTSSKSLNIFAGSTDEDLVEVMHISKSGNSPRIGIGTNNPLTNFDFKDVSDSSAGTKMILRSSRPTKGGDNGDEAGKINFVIDSSSYGDIETSGSVAKILGSATTIDTDGAAGKLSFEVSDVFTPKEDTTEVFRLQKNPLGSFDLTYTVGVFEGSVNLNGANSSLYAGKDVEADGNLFTTNGYIQSTNGYVRANNLRIGTSDSPGNNSAIIQGNLITRGDTTFGNSSDDIHTFTGNITASNNVSASGDIIANNGSFSGDLTVEGDIIAQNYIVSSSVTYMTQSFSSGSTIFGDTQDDTHQFTGSVDITGSLTIDGITFPIADGDNGDTLITDGAGNLSFARTTVYANVKNVHGSELVKGMPVHVTGAAGNTSEVIAASASNAATMPAHFILNETLADDAEGLAIAVGYINQVNTGDFSEGDTVYVGADGGYTNVKPTGSNLIQNLGIVDKVDASNGSGFILGAGRSNDVPNISPGYVWVGNNSSVATAVATSSLSVATASFVGSIHGGTF